MTNVILVGGLGLLVASAILMTRREWRLAALIFGLLAIPGNLDDFLPQMTLDPNAIANNTAPAVSVIDLLLIWGVVLTVRERPLNRMPTWLMQLAGALAAVACLAAAAAVLRGVEPLAAVRGVIVFLRIVAVFYLAGSLIQTGRVALRLALGTVAGGVILLANGLYTSTVTGQDRFTASTFGRNTFAIALVVVCIVAAGIVFSRWNQRTGSRPDFAIVIGSSIVAATALFGAVATGTRMSLVVLIAAGLLGLLLNHTWRSPRGVMRVGAIAVVALAIIGAATIFSAGGSRTISIITQPGATIDAVTDPGSLPVYSEIRSRGDFWGLAIQMAMDNPVLGVGPYQWNIQRYRYAQFEPLVADAHNTYLQAAAEYGLPTAALYLVLLGCCLAIIVLAARGRSASAQNNLTVAAIAAAAVAYPLADLTNSNLFNVRMGLIGWLLIAVAVAYATASHQRGESNPARAAVR